jgi:hypothetical protein
VSAEMRAAGTAFMDPPHHDGGDQSSVVATDCWGGDHRPRCVSGPGRSVSPGLTAAMANCEGVAARLVGDQDVSPHTSAG